MCESITESEAATPVALDKRFLNQDADIPWGVTPLDIYKTMQEYLDFLKMINESLVEKGMPRLESFLMQANFSSMVGEFMASNLPRFCTSVVKNRYHNGHPDIVPAGMFKDDAIQHDHRGIEVKGSRYLRGWQGHNAEKTFLMVFIFNSNRPPDSQEGIGPMKFRFRKVLAAHLEIEDWKFADRSATSRRTITAAVTKSGVAKMYANWIYDEDFKSSTEQLSLI